MRVQVLRQLPEAGRLASVQGGVALRVVPDQHLAECRVHGLNMPPKLRAILEVELGLATPLRRGGGGEAVLLSVGEYRRAELLVDQDGGVVLWQAGSQGYLQTPIDHLLRRCDASTLIGCKQ